jgi:hypothetical protein
LRRKYFAFSLGIRAICRHVPFEMKNSNEKQRMMGRLPTPKRDGRGKMSHNLVKKKRTPAKKKK